MSSELILGSQSPRRSEILNYFNLPFKQVNSSFDENSVPFKGNPQYYVQEVAEGKAKALAQQFPSAIIITADTMVFKDNKPYGKPNSEEEAFLYLQELRGVWHSVFSGVTVHHKGEMFSAVEETRVLFNFLNDEQLRAYLHALPVKDKAGAYMIQQSGGLIIKRIEGCYYNVVGLPINALCDLLKKVGIDLWKHLKES